MTKHEASKVPSPRKLAHAVLRTRDNYRAMIDWYCRVLNARTVYASDFLTFLTYDDEHHRIAIAHMPDLQPRDGRRIGLDHLAFTYDSVDDLLATYRRLKDEGIEPFCPVNHGPTTSLYYQDPDGNRIELQVDNFEHMDDATQFMAEAFDANPVGILFEPDTMLAERNAGASAEELTRLDIATLSPPEPELMRKLLSN